MNVCAVFGKKKRSFFLSFFSKVSLQNLLIGKHAVGRWREIQPCLIPLLPPNPPGVKVSDNSSKAFCTPF